MSNNSSDSSNSSVNPRNIFVISGPSGSGKTTLIKRLMALHPRIVFSTSHTTRTIRAGETHGKEYYFVSVEEFLRLRDNGEFVEWAEVYGNYYGTSLKEIETKSVHRDENGGFTLVLDIDVQGAINIRKKYPEAQFVLITPPSMEELRNRLIIREQKIDAHFEHRLRIANEELQQFNVYDYIVINDQLEEAFSILNSIFIAFQNTTARRAAFMKERFFSQGDKS